MQTEGFVLLSVPSWLEIRALARWWDAR